MEDVRGGGLTAHDNGLQPDPIRDGLELRLEQPSGLLRRSLDFHQPMLGRGLATSAVPVVVVVVIKVGM